MSASSRTVDLTVRTVEFKVFGTPAPQGSKRAFVVKGRPVLTESSSKVKPWREAVKWSAIDAMDGRKPLDRPLALQVTFLLPRPASLSKANAALGPIRKPDLDKLLRSTMDAMSDAGVWTDDSRVVWITAQKRFNGDSAFIAGLSGAVVKVFAVDEGPISQ